MAVLSTSMRLLQAGRGIADDRFGHAVDTDGLTGQHVLEQAYGAAGDGAGNGAAAADGEEQGDD